MTRLVNEPPEAAAPPPPGRLRDGSAAGRARGTLHGSAGRTRRLRGSAARNRCAALRPPPPRRGTGCGGRARSGGGYATAPCPDRWPAMARRVAPERPVKAALPRATGRTRRQAGRRSRRTLLVAMQRPVVVPRTPARPSAARREPALGSEREGAAATPPQGGRREASMPRAGNGWRDCHPAGRPARPRRCGSLWAQLKIDNQSMLMHNKGTTGSCAVGLVDHQHHLD